MRRALGTWWLGVSAVLSIACGSQTQVIGDAGGGGQGGAAGGGGAGGQGAAAQVQEVSRVDLLFVVDNSRSMADKQEVLALSAQDLVGGLVAPPCLDASGAAVPAQDGVCPAGSARPFAPVRDLHIGVVSSSLGGIENACDDAEVGLDDRAHLLARSADGGLVETHQGLGFLAWDPDQLYGGEADLDVDGPADDDTTAILPSLRSMILGVGQLGCGYERPLEATYRFLVDPEPYEDLVLVGSTATPQGVDEALLAQRAAFLRPDSLVIVVLLTDEDDCSIRDDGQYWVAGRTDGGYRLPRARTECASDPADPCCASCAQGAPPGCPLDPSCSDPGGGFAVLAPEDDPPNLRCFDQKRRFGIDFLYPTSRYVEGLSMPTLVDADGALLPNPLFSDLDPSDATTLVRSPEHVLFATIAGAPWQDLAIDPSDAKKGLRAAADVPWSVVLGELESFTPPEDPFNVPSIDVRGGASPITSHSPSSENPINGHDRLIVGRDDLQHACIFPLFEPRDCSALAAQGVCDCPSVAGPEDQTDSALCMADPAQDHVQIAAKAYPSLRVLDVARGLGGQAVTGSICPPQLADASGPDYGYRIVAKALLDRAASVLVGE